MSRPVVRDFAAVLAAAVLLALPFHLNFLWPLPYIAFIPYFFSIENKSTGRVVFQSYIFGVLFFAMAGYWLNYVNVFGFIALTLYLGVYFALFGYFVPRLLFSAAAPGRIRAAFYMAAVWVILEWVRGWMLSGLPWNLLGYSQWKNLPLIQIADLTGAWGVSFFVMLANVLLFQFARHKKDALRCVWALVAIAALVTGYGYLRLAQWNPGAARPSIRVSVVQGNIPQDQKWDGRVRGIIFEKYKRLTLMCANESSDLIVWPETSFPGFFEDEPVMAAHLRSTIRQAKTPTLVGAPTLGDLEGGLRFYNSALLFSQNGEEGQRYSKTHLVPFGEYLPLETITGFLRHFVTIGRFSPGREKTIFLLPARLRNYLTARFGVLICYEDVFPGLVRAEVRHGADFLVNITNDAWFGNTAAPYQHAQASVFRAVENRVPVVRATNTGFSCFISATGEVTNSVQDNGREIMVTGHATEGIYLKKGFSLYNRLGDWFIVFCLALTWLSFRESPSSPRYSRL